MLRLLCVLATVYVGIVVTTAGITLELGPIVVRSQRLVNPAMLLILLLVMRCWAYRRRGPSAKPVPAPEGVPWTARLWGAPCAVALLALLAWGPALNGGFIREDFIRIELVAAGAPWNGQVLVDPATGSWGTRQMSVVFASMDRFLWGLWTPGWHSTSFLMHLTCSALVAGLGLVLGLGSRVAVLAGTLFSVMPLAVEPVAWVSARDDLGATLFSLIALVLVVRAWRCGRGGLMVGAVASYGLALFSKESSYSLPAGVMVMLAMVRSESPSGSNGNSSLVRLVKMSLPFFVILGGAVGLHRSAAHAPGFLDQLVDFPKMFMFPLSPLGPLFFPVNMAAIGVLPAYARALMALVLTGTVWITLSDWRRLTDARALGLYALTLVFTAPVYRMIHLSASLQNGRYLYLPGAGFCLWLAYLLDAAAVTAAPGRQARLMGLWPLAVIGSWFVLARVAAVPWTLAGEVATRINRDSAALLPALSRPTGRVLVSGVPEQVLGAPLFLGSNVLVPMRTYHHIPEGAVSRLVELYHEGASAPAPRPDDLHFHWMPDRGFVVVNGEQRSAPRPPADAN